MQTIAGTKRQVSRPEILLPGVSKLNLSFAGITKRFGEVLANDSISFDIESGGIHAIVGENGAGKSTLMKVLSGYYQPDSGSVFLEDRQIKLTSPADARKIGIGMVHQRFTLVPALSVLENILLGDARLPFLINKNRQAEEVEAKARQLDFKFDLNQPAGQLNMADRQKLEIFKLLWRGTRVVILDEPTSQLSPFEAEDVLNIANDLAKSGKIVILITHHINEVLQFSEHLTVLRSGRCVASNGCADMSADEVARLMVVLDDVEVRPAMATESSSSRLLLSIKDISVKAAETNRKLKDISLDLHSGEILGIAGVAGSGQDELAMILSGLLVPDSGQVIYKESEVDASFLKELNAAYVPADQSSGSVTSLSVSENASLKTVIQGNSILVNPSSMRKHAVSLIDQFGISPQIPDVPAGALSGGNLQRLILGRELGSESPILVAENPCAGLDAAMTLTVRQHLKDVARSGKVVVLISPDIDELVGTCDRVAVMCNGAISGCLPASELDSQSLGLLMGGVEMEIVMLLKNLEQDGLILDSRVYPALKRLKASRLVWQRRLAVRVERKLKSLA